MITGIDWDMKHVLIVTLTMYDLYKKSPLTAKIKIVQQLIITKIYISNHAYSYFFV